MQASRATARVWSRRATWWCVLSDPHDDQGSVEDDGALDLAGEEVRELLGEGEAAVRAFAQMLQDQGVVRGLIGPRELDRLWSRHLLNCAAVARLLPDTGTMVDVGSGGGLPGVVLAAMRPGMDVVLVEAMARRVAWLDEVVAELGLTNTRVLRGRAEEVHHAVVADVVTARAVAPMDRLVGWTMPFLRIGGELLAMKGRSADEEVAAARSTLREYGAGAVDVVSVRAVDGVSPTTVVRVVRAESREPARARKRRRA